jgi:hypothetical protein
MVSQGMHYHADQRRERLSITTCAETGKLSRGTFGNRFGKRASYGLEIEVQFPLLHSGLQNVVLGCFIPSTSRIHGIECGAGVVANRSRLPAIWQKA